MQQKNLLLNNEFNKYQFLAVSIATRYKSYNIEQKDLVQAAYLGLITGINKCSVIEEKHKINYLSKYILGEIISTLKSYNKYNYNKEYFKYNKILKENPDLNISTLIKKYNLNKNILLEIIQKEEIQEDIIDNNEYLLNDKQKKIYNFIVLRKYSVTKVAKLLNERRIKVLSEVKEIYNLIKK